MKLVNIGVNASLIIDALMALDQIESLLGGIANRHTDNYRDRLIEALEAADPENVLAAYTINARKHVRIGGVLRDALDVTNIYKEVEEVIYINVAP